MLTSEIIKIQKKIKLNHGLSMELWDTGNAEARILSLLIADPKLVTRTDANRLVNDGPVRFLGPYIASLVAHSPTASATMTDWMKSKDEDTRHMGYEVLGVRLKDEPASITDTDAEAFISAIEREIHKSPNQAKHAMNGALISIGVFKSPLRDKAIAAARRIGKVAVDHGDTNCRTPDAAAYIDRASSRSART